MQHKLEPMLSVMDQMQCLHITLPATTCILQATKGPLLEYELNMGRRSSQDGGTQQLTQMNDLALAVQIV